MHVFPSERAFGGRRQSKCKRFGRRRACKQARSRVGGLPSGPMCVFDKGMLLLLALSFVCAIEFKLP